MLASASQLTQAHNTCGSIPSRSSRILPLNLSLPRSYTYKGIPSTPDDKWKVVSQPFKPKLKREQVQTKRKVALKFVALILSFSPFIHHYSFN